MTTPMNETLLYALGWRNGLLFPQMNGNFTPYPGNKYDQGVSLRLYDDYYAGLTFQVFSPIMNSAFALTESIFDTSRIQINISCVYPISGQYNTLSRALFYVLIVFSLVFRRHVWISVAALGTAMTYAAVSAVHLFALVGSFGFSDPGGWDPESAKAYMDLDILGIFPILTASGIMLTPILMWSTTVRRHNAQAVIVCWGALILVALATCLGVLMRGFGIIGGGTMEANTLPSFALCLGTDDCRNPESTNLFRDYYNKCQCIDFCGTLSPAARMRNGENMVPYLYTGADEVVQSDGFGSLFILNLFALAFITVNGAIGVLESYYSQSEVRNAIFRLCNADLRLWIKVLFAGEREEKLLKRYSRQDKNMKETMRKKIRFHIAKAIAAMFYLSAIFLSVICPIIFISSIISNEIYIQTFPPSEHSDAVGAWGAWVGATLVILAAVIEKYNKAWLNAIVILLRASWRVFKYAKHERQSILTTDKDMSVREKTKDFFEELRSPFVHGWNSTKCAIWTGWTNMRLFAAWWKDTVYQSQMRGADLQLVWDAEVTKNPGGKPICPCSMCRNDRENKKLDGEHETHRHVALDRVRTKVQKKREEYENLQKTRGEYESVNSAPDTPALGMEMLKLQKMHQDRTSGSTLTGGMETSEEDLYDGPATTPRMSGSRMSVAYDPTSPPAIPQSAMQRPGFQRGESGPSSPPPLISPHQVPLPEAALERRSGYARRDTDQSFGYFDTRRESDQSMQTLVRRDTDQSMGPLTRRDPDQSMGPLTRRDTDMSTASRPRRKPVPSYIAPEDEGAAPWPRTMSPDQASPRRDWPDSGS
ncbi:hypothetical protein V499_01956 [Pseudogymnoascus sp. VKM F-103]|nr:hypothetical protein V499_01956 [Pseudogymnoascus sp. VKM F-103]